jgi:hypothetical protein
MPREQVRKGFWWKAEIPFSVIRPCKKSEKSLRGIPAKAGNGMKFLFFRIVKKGAAPLFKGMATFCSAV